MQSLIDNMFGQFIKAVADGRGLKYDDVKAIANGKVWTGQQALSMKLIDNVGDFQNAVDDTAKMVNIKGEPTLVRPERDRRTLMDLLLGDVSQYLPSREKLMEQQVGFYYLWK
jgi:protease IV